MPHPIQHFSAAVGWFDPIWRHEGPALYVRLAGVMLGLALLWLTFRRGAWSWRGGLVRFVRNLSPARWRATYARSSRPPGRVVPFGKLPGESFDYIGFCAGCGDQLARADDLLCAGCEAAPCRTCGSVSHRGYCEP